MVLFLYKKTVYKVYKKPCKPCTRPSKNLRKPRLLQAIYKQLIYCADVNNYFPMIKLSFFTVYSLILLTILGPCYLLGLLIKNVYVNFYFLVIVMCCRNVASKIILCFFMLLFASPIVNYSQFEAINRTSNRMF